MGQGSVRTGNYEDRELLGQGTIGQGTARTGNYEDRELLGRELRGQGILGREL